MLRVVNVNSGPEHFPLPESFSNSAHRIQGCWKTKVLRQRATWISSVRRFLGSELLTLQICGVTPPGSLQTTRAVLQNCRWQMLWHQLSHRCGDISAPAVTVGRALGMWKYTRVFFSYFPPPPFKYLKRSDRFFVRNGLCVYSSKPKCVPSDVSDSTRFQVTPWAPPATTGRSSSFCRQLCLPCMLLSTRLAWVQQEAVPSLHCLHGGEKARQSSAWSCQLRLIKTSLQIRLSPCVLVLFGFPKSTENITTVSVGQRDNEEFQVAQGS